MSDPRTVTIINGDGIGPEVMDATIRVLEALKVPLTFEAQEAGAEIVSKYGTNLPPATVDSVLRNGVALKGPTGTAVGSGLGSANVALRKQLDLYASLRPVKSIPGVKTRYEDVDLVVVRENTEGLYSGLESVIAPGVVTGTKVMTEKACTRIVRYAFEWARDNGRKKVSVVHKANIQKLTDGLLLDCARKVNRDFPELQYEEVIIDNMAMQLVKDPSAHDVMVTENLYGDILSDLCAGLVGGLGVVPGANIGERCSVFEAVHGTAPDIAGKNLANPSALMMSAVMMLEHLKLKEEAARFEAALMRVYADGSQLTRDLGGTATTREFTDAVIDAL